MIPLYETPRNVACSALVLLIAVSSFLPGGKNPIPGRRAYCPAGVSVTRIVAEEGGAS